MRRRMRRTRRTVVPSQKKVAAMMPSQSDSTTDQLLRECAATGGVPNQRTINVLYQRWHRFEPNAMTPDQHRRRS